jgi:hypothetical protein
MSERVGRKAGPLSFGDKGCVRNRPTWHTYRKTDVAPKAPIVPVQCWLARHALGWSVNRLALAADVPWDSVRNFEGGSASKATTVEAIQRALEAAGVIWIDAKDGGPGARLRKAE